MHLLSLTYRFRSPLCCLYIYSLFTAPLGSRHCYYSYFIDEDTGHRDDGSPRATQLGKAEYSLEFSVPQPPYSVYIPRIPANYKLFKGKFCLIVSGLFLFTVWYSCSCYTTMTLLRHNNDSNLVALSTHFILLNDIGGQEFGQGTKGMTGVSSLRNLTSQLERLKELEVTRSLDAGTIWRSSFTHLGHGLRSFKGWDCWPVHISM